MNERPQRPGGPIPPGGILESLHYVHEVLDYKPGHQVPRSNSDNGGLIHNFLARVENAYRNRGKLTERIVRRGVEIVEPVYNIFKDVYDELATGTLIHVETPRGPGGFSTMDVAERHARRILDISHTTEYPGSSAATIFEKAANTSDGSDVQNNTNHHESNQQGPLYLEARTDGSQQKMILKLD